MRENMIAKITQKMIAASEGSTRDINHFLKVWSYARTIGRLEGLDERTQFILEATAVVHDIACPSLRARFGTADGKRQEEEGPALVYDFYKDLDLPEEIVDRIAYLVGHHHTYTGVDGPDHRILLEADYLVNAEEGGDSLKKISRAYAGFFRTESGRALLKDRFFSKVDAPMTIEIAKEEDLEEIYDFYNTVIASFGEHPYCPGWRKDVYPDKTMIKEAIGEGSLMVGRIGGMTAAAMVLNHQQNPSYLDYPWPEDLKEEEISVLHLLAVHPLLTGKGLSKVMVDHAISTCRETGQKSLRLDVIKGNLPAEHLYPAMGFTYLTTMPMYYVDTGWTDFLLYELKL